ncbi:MAG: RDD family protein [Bacillota bacterium]|nr:RDD family protein [Bacillota bacterium]
MKKIKITTPENIEVEYTLADVGSRTAAAVIDYLIQGIVFFILLVIVFLILYFAPRFWFKYYGWIIGISLLLYGFITLGYFIAAELSTNGMSIGKKKLGIRVIRNNGQPITLAHSALRNFFRVFVDNYGVGVVLMFFTKQHKRVGDLIGSTIVVAEENRTQPISLEELQNMNESFSYYVTKEEYELLKEYFRRRGEMEDCSMLRAELKLHFTRKFQALNILADWQGFINSL